MLKRIEAALLLWLLARLGRCEYCGDPLYGSIPIHWHTEPSKEN